MPLLGSSHQRPLELKGPLPILCPPPNVLGIYLAGDLARASVRPWESVGWTVRAGHVFLAWLESLGKLTLHMPLGNHGPSMNLESVYFAT